MANYKWTEEDDLLIKQSLLENKTIKQIFELLNGPTLFAVKNRVRKFSTRKSRTPSNWSEKDLKYLLDNYLNKTVKELSSELGKKESAIYSKLNILNLDVKTCNSPWTSCEEKYITDNFYKKSYSSIAKYLGRPTSTVESKAISLGLKKIAIKWTETEVEYLKENYSDSSMDVLIDSLKRPASAIHNKAYKLKLVKNNSVLTEKEKLFIISQALVKSDFELATILKCSETTVKMVRNSEGIYKTGNEVSGPTGIESKIKDFLVSQNVSFIYNQFLDRFKPDFQIENTKLIIEVQGDYWHCNPKVYQDGPKDLIQMDHILRDYTKNCFYISNNYKVLYLWEYDIVHNFDKVKNDILNFILPSTEVIL